MRRSTSALLLSLALFASPALAADGAEAARKCVAQNARTERELIKSLSHPNRDVRVRAAWALGLIESKAAKVELVKLTAEEQPEVVRRAAFEALGQSERPAKDKAGLLADLDAQDLRTRRRALQALAKTGPHASAVGEKVLSLLDDPEPLIQAEACRVLAGVRMTGLKDRLLPLLESKHFLVRRAAARTAAEHRISAAGKRLVELLGDSDYTVREAAVWALAEMGLRDGIEPVADRLSDSTPEVRQAAADGLVQYGADAALQATSRRLLSKDSPVAARRLAAWVFMKWRDPRSADTAFVALIDADPQVKAYALRTLALIGDPRAVTHALSILTEWKTVLKTSNELCEAAWFAARKAKDARFIPLIRKRLELGPRWEAMSEKGQNLPTTNVDMVGAILAAGHFKRDDLTKMLRRMKGVLTFELAVGEALAMIDGTEWIPPGQGPERPEKVEFFVHCLD